MTVARLAPGAVVLVSPPADEEAARRILLAPFRDVAERPQVLLDDGLGMAWLASSRCRVHVSESTICLLEGVVYELGPRVVALAGEGRSAEESVASAWRRIGEGVLGELRGDFWVVLWDRRSRRGLVACDQMGGHCPRWARLDGGLLLASDIPEVLAALPRLPDPDPVALTHWLALTEPPPQRTLFSAVSRLPAGHLLDLGGAGGSPRRYWTLRYGPLLDAPREELGGILLGALRRAVERRLGGEEVASVLLSGGLDSSVVSALAVGAPGARRLETYTAVSPGHPSVDEAGLVDLTTEALGVPSTRVVVRGGSVLRGALPYLATWHEPPTSPNLFFWLPLFDRASVDGVRVMLDGEGGDELFGLAPYLLADRLRRGRVVSAVRLIERMPSMLANPMAPGRVLRLLLSFGVRGALPAGVQRLRRRLRGAERYRPRWLRPEHAGAWLATEASHGWKSLDGPRWWASQVDVVTQGLGPTLVYDQSRRRAALGGVEPRHPLVDVDVVELALRVPPEANYDPRFSRPLVREAMAGLLPDAVLLRREKSNFDAVFHAALAGPDLPAVRRILGAEDALIRDYVDSAVLHRDVLEPGPPAHPRPLMLWAVQVWRLLMAECWLRAHRDPGYLAELPGREGLEAADCSVVAGSIGSFGG